MDIAEWWARLDPATRQWLIAHNGEAVPGDVAGRIFAAGGPAPTDAWWALEDGSDGPTFPDEAIDWVETVANDEAGQHGDRL